MVAIPTSSAPMNRSGVLNRQSTTSPAVLSSSGPAPNAATRPSAPGKLVTHSATKVIQSMPSPISLQHKVIGDVRDGRGACEQRYDEQAGDFAPTPERDLGGQRRLAALAHPGQPLLVPGDEGQSCCERHLEARMDDGFRCE